MRIGFVVQRYGLDVNGGAELHCRELAEHVSAAPRVSRVKVFTTCARDHTTWANHYSPGTSELNGVEVERFRVWFERRRSLQSLFGKLALEGPHLESCEEPWFLAQGPVAPSLLRALEESAHDFDVFVFFTYLYYPTVFGLPKLASRSLFVPTAHDEPALRARLALRAFRLARAVAFNTHEERELVASRIDVSHTRSDVVGCGVELGSAASPEASPARPYLLYLGRVETAKGVPELVRGFQSFRRGLGDRSFPMSRGSHIGRDLELVLAGRAGDMRSDGDPNVIYAGFVSEARRSELVRGAEAVVIPGKLDSLSLSLLEAWAQGIPTLSTSQCPVKSGHARRARAGYEFGPERSFASALETLLSDPNERERSVAAGRAYVRDNYAWPSVLERFMTLARYVADAN
ncbi:MAG: glycosyltransferase family 4 protein [Polyangiaceae bacterium]